MGNTLIPMLGGLKIVVTTKRVQNRTHRKARINKKWAKRYGFTEYNIQKDGQPLMVPGSRLNGCSGYLYMTLNDYKQLLLLLKGGKRHV